MRAGRLRIAIALVIGAINFGWALDADAALTHYIPFDVGYLAGTDLHGSGGSDLGFGANTWFDGAMPGLGSTVVAGNLAAPAGLPVAGNHASTPPLPSIDFNLAFYPFDLDNDGNNGEPEDALQTGTHWLSFVGSCNLGADFAGLSFKKFFGPEVLYIGKSGGAFGSEWGMDAQDGNGSIGAGGDSTVESFLAVKLILGPNANDDTAELYINPPIAATPPAIADLTLSFNEDPNGDRALDEIRLGSEGGPFLADEIRIGGSFADVVGMSISPGCDFDNSGTCDISDIDALVAEVVAGTNDLTYDLTGDGSVTRDDINDPNDGWLRLAGEENIGPGRSYLEGDVTLDGIVDGLDFIEWNNHKFTTSGLWSLADVTADGTTDGLDFIVWNDNKFTSSDGSAVPEPTGLLMMLAGLLTFGVSRRR